MRRILGGVSTSTMALAVASGLANVVSYGLTLVATRRMGPSAFGAFAALLAVAIVAGVPGYAVQAVIARSTAARMAGRTGLPDAARTIPIRAATRAGLWTGVATGLVTLAFAPALDRFLHLGGLAAPVWLAVSATLVLPAYAMMGLAQGVEQLTLLGALLVVLALFRVAGGLAGMLVAPTPSTTLAGTAVGFAAASVVSVVAVDRVLGRSWLTRRFRTEVALPGRRAVPVLDEPFADAAAGAVLDWPEASGAPADPRLAPPGQVVRASAALLGMTVLANLDPVLARHVLPAAEAGAYGVGNLLTKIAFWAPQFVALGMFAGLADPQRRAMTVRRAYLVVGFLAVLGTLVALVAGPLIVRILAGPGYAQAGDVAWLFAALGGVLALAQLGLYAAIAVHARLAAVALWAAVAGEAAVILLGGVSTIDRVAMVALTMATAASLVAALDAWLGRGHALTPPS